jgi:hypothetical protein
MRAGAGLVSGYVFADFVQDGAQKRGRFAIEHRNFPLGRKRENVRQRDAFLPSCRLIGRGNWLDEDAPLLALESTADHIIDDEPRHRAAAFRANCRAA